MKRPLSGLGLTVDILTANFSPLIFGRDRGRPRPCDFLGKHSKTVSLSLLKPRGGVATPMRGGYRPGSGRKQGSRNKQHVVVVEDPSALMPIDWMLAVLRDPRPSKTAATDGRVSRALCACETQRGHGVNSHSSSNSRDNGDTNGLQILAVPRGAGSTQRRDNHDRWRGLASLQPIEPFTGTPAIDRSTRL